MNKIYKNVWNHVTRTFTAVSEIKAKKGKVGKSVLATTVASVILGCGSPSVCADDYESDWNTNDTIALGNFYIGNNSQSGIKREDETTLYKGVLGDGIGLSFSLGNANYEDIEGTQGLLAQGTSGFRQFIFESGDLSIRLEGIDRFDKMFNTSAHGSLSQGLVQNGENVATLHYAAAGRAYQLFLRNQGTIDANYEVESNGRIYFDGVRLGYTDDGIAIAYENIDPEGLYLLTFLTGIELKQGQTLVLDGLDSTDDQNHRNVLSPIISGSGSLTLKGSGSVDIESVITLDENGNAYNSANTYTGETTIESSGKNKFVVNLNKVDSFGQTSKLTATNAEINVKRADAWTSVQRIDSTKSTISFASSQTSFSITGSDAAGAPAAQFTGDNVINVAADTFTLNVSNGSLEVGREAGKDEDDNTIFTTGSLTIQNSDANSQSLVLSIGNNLNINGDSLLNLADSADSRTINVGQNVTFNQVNLATYGIKADELIALGQVDLIKSEGVYSLNTRADKFRVSDGVIRIDANTKVVVQETDVVSGASLQVSKVDQLGETIRIENKTDGNGQVEKTSTLRVTHSGALNFDKTVSGDGVLHLDLSDGSDLTFEDGAGGEDNSVLVRMSNATYTYDINDDFNRYVVGGNGKFISGSEALKLDTIGWQYNTEDSYGIIDLSKYEFDVKTGPAIDATNIHLSNGANIIQIDVSDFTGQSVSTTPGDILTLDAANPDRLLIKGTAGASGNRDITLQDPDGYVIPPDQSKPTYLISSNDTDGTERAAKLNWGIDASYHDTSESGIKENGIYLDYSVQTIQLLNGSQDDNSDMGTLRYEAALVANGTTENTDNSLESRLTGKGILEFGNSGTAPVNIAITNFFTDDARRNNYTGATVVRTSTTLQSMAAGLGNSTLVLIGANANFDLYVADNTEDLALHGITTDDAAHTITIGKNGTLTLDANTLSEDDRKALGAETAYNVDLQEGNVFGLKTQLQGEGSLVLISDLNAASAGAFNSFKGNVTLSGDEKRTLTIGAVDQDTVLTNGVFVSDGTDTHVIYLKSGAQIGKTEGAVGADFSGFKGILKLGEGKALDIYNMSSLGSSAIQADKGSSLVMNSISGELLNGGLTVLNGGTVTMNAKGSTGTLDYSKVAFANKVGAFKLDLEKSKVTLTNSGQNISDNLAADLDGASTLNLTGSGDSVDWSNLTGDEGSTVFLTNSSTTDRTLTIKNIAEGFDGTSKFRGFDFTFGANSNPTHADLLAGHTFEFLNSNLTANGLSTVERLTLRENSSLSFIESDDWEFEVGGKSSSLITVADGGSLNLGDAEIRIDTGKINFDQTTEPSYSTTNKSLLEALNTEQGKYKEYFQIVEGNVTGGGTLTDLNGNELDANYVVDVIGANGRTVAQIGSGATLIPGGEGNGLWIGQGVQYMKLLDSMNLNADVIGKEDLTDGAFVVNARITSDESASNLTLTIDGETPIQLNGAGGAFYGTTKVADKGHLILGADNALGENGAALEVDQGGTLTVQNVDQAVRSMKVNGTLNLEKDSRLLFKKDAVAEIGADAVLDAEGTWDLSAGARMVIVAAEKGQKLTSGSVSGGTISKTGSGVLTLGHDVVDSHDVAIEVTEGSLNVEDWNSDEYLTLNSLTLAGASSDEFVEFDLAGNLNTSKGFTASNAKIWVGSRNYTADSGFADKVINGGYSGNATFVFNVQLGEDESFGDSLTINDGVADGSHADLFVNVVGKDKFAIKGLTLLKVEVDPEEGTAVSEDFASLAEGNTVEAGGYEWFLDSYIDGSYREWHLTNQLDQSNNQHETETIGVRLGSLSAFAASVDMFDMNIHDRQGTRPWINPVTGEKTMTSLWMRQTLSKESSSDSSGQLSGDAKENVTMIGGDILQLSPSGSGLVYAGLMAGYGGSDYDGSSNRVTDTTSADIEAWMVGAYAGWNQNDPKVDRSGAYVSGWVQYAHFKGDTMRTNSRTIEAKAEGIAASLEAGWVVKAAEFQMQGGETKGAFYVEPHAQVTWWGADYDNIEEESIRFEGQHNITTRLGARLTMETSGATNFSPYLEANWVHNTKDYGAVWNDAESYIEGAGNQAELKFGAETFFTDSFSGYAQIRANWGGDGYNRQEGSLGLKYRF